MENKSNFLKEKINKINEIITTKHVLLILAVYVLGTAILWVRNLNEGIPFSTYSIITYAILTFYFVVFASASWFAKYWLELIVQNEYKGNKFTKFIKIFSSSLLAVALITVIMFMIMSQILYNTESTEIIAHAFLLYCLWPALSILSKNRSVKEFSIIMIVFTTLSVIFNIPASIGGLKPTQTKFYSYHDNIIYDYLYYGESNGNFIFKENENKITLRSCDSGYIEYYRDDIEEVKPVKYKIEIKETLSKVVEVEAADEGEALRKIQEQYKNGEIVLDSVDYVDTEIEVYRD